MDKNTGNYANISLLMDLLFGTYVCPSHKPEAVGIQEGFSKNYIGQMLEPNIGKSRWNRFQDFFKK